MLFFFKIIRNEVKFSNTQKNDDPQGKIFYNLRKTQVKRFEINLEDSFDMKKNVHNLMEYEYFSTIFNEQIDLISLADNLEFKVKFEVFILFCSIINIFYYTV
jgi:hypothetical protein